MEETSLLPARKTFSRIGLALSAILVIATIAQLLWLAIPMAIWGKDNWAVSSSWGMWIGTFAPLYLIAIPVGLLILRKLPAQVPEDHTLGVGIILKLNDLTDNMDIRRLQGITDRDVERLRKYLIAYQELIN